ncbi:MAG: immunoglobulin domain-containing protein [Planctomycetota bacterium]|nr:immunoglobulin domain-containing protein [Planctomycetota bacterium]
MKIVHATDSAPTLRARPITESAFSGLCRSGRACAIATLTLSAGVAAAQSVLVDQFKQPSTVLSGSEGGRGFVAPWQSAWQSFVVAPDGLTYTDTTHGIALATTGGRAANPGGLMPIGSNDREMGFSVYPSGTPFWGSFLVRCPVEPGRGSAHITLRGYGDAHSLAIGVNNSWVEIASRWGGAQRAGFIDFDQTALILFRVDSQTGGGGPVSVWVNPPLSGELPPPSTVLFYSNFGPYGPSVLGLQAQGDGYSLDEIRFGPNAATVLPRSSVSWPCSIGGNGHRYETVHTVDPISWEEAAAAAQLRGGNLVTLTSVEENQLVFENLIAREDVWDRQYGGPIFFDTRGPWIGASRPTYFPDPISGWEWNGGEAWDFTSWSPEGLVGIGDRYASFYMGTDQATPTWRNANISGDDRVYGYVVEYESGITQQPQDVTLVQGTTAQFSVSVAGDPMSMSFQWFRNGALLTDAPTPQGSWIVGATSPTLQIENATIADCGTYSVHVVTECGEAQSNSARLKADAINASVLDPNSCHLIRIVTLPEPVEWYTAQNDAFLRGGHLLSIESQRTQAIVDAITQEPQLWHTNSLNQQVGPWVGASYNSTMGQWYWRSGLGFNDTGFTNWAPGQPDNVGEGWGALFMYLTRQGNAGISQWADRPGYFAGGFPPNSYIMEWYSPFRQSWGSESVTCGTNAMFDGSLVDHGLQGTFLWLGPDYTLVVDGTSTSGTQISGQGTPVLHLTGVSEADAGSYTLYLNAGCYWAATYTLRVNDCAPACPADFNQDGGVDGADVDAFFSAWESGDASADVNQDGGVDGSDIDPFFFAWENGGC